MISLTVRLFLLPRVMQETEFTFFFSFFQKIISTNVLSFTSPLRSTIILHDLFFLPISGVFIFMLSHPDSHFSVSPASSMLVASLARPASCPWMMLGSDSRWGLSWHASLLITGPSRPLARIGSSPPGQISTGIASLSCLSGSHVSLSPERGRSRKSVICTGSGRVRSLQVSDQTPSGLIQSRSHQRRIHWHRAQVEAQTHRVVAGLLTPLVISG
jgi:hypothetical protein